MRHFTYKSGYRLVQYLIQHHFGMDREAYDQRYNEDAAEKPYLSDRDWFWGFLNWMLIQPVKDPQELYMRNRGIYHAMAIYMSEYEGKSGLQYSKLSLNQEWESFKLKDGIICDACVVADPDCPSARVLQGRTFDLDKEPPVPTKECERGFCRCSLTRKPRRDADGRLVMLNQ